MKKALIFHGTLGSPEGNWFAWLQDYLMTAGWQVAVPKLPTPEGQNLDNWVASLQAQITDLNDLDLVIGHSLGATFALRLIEKGFIKPKETILVSALIDVIGNEEYDALNMSFVDTPFKWETIKNTGSNITIIHGDNDPYVPIEQPLEIANKLNIDLQLLKDGGHINTETGFTDFPEILDFIHV